MIELLYYNNLLNLNAVDYEISSIEIMSDLIVYLEIFNKRYNCTYAVVANKTTINGVLQTSAQMIIDTLTNA